MPKELTAFLEGADLDAVAASVAEGPPPPAESEAQQVVAARKPKTVTRTAPTRPKPAADEFDLPDSGFDPDLDLDPAELPRPEKSKPTPAPETAAPVGGGTDTPAAGPAASKPAGPAHPAWLARYAKSVGFTDDEVAEHATAAELKAAVEFVVRLQEGHRRDRGESPPGGGTAAGGGTATPAAATAPAAEPEVDLREEFGIDPDDYDEKTRAVFKKLAEKNRSLEKKLGTFEEQEQRRRLKTISDVIDDGFTELDPDGSLFGKGTRHDIEDGSREHKRRIAVLREADINPKDPPSVREMKQKLRKAKEVLFGTTPRGADAGGATDGAYGEGMEAPAPAQKPDRPRDPATGLFLSDEEIAGRERTESLKKNWANGALPRPTQRQTTPEPKGPRRAAKAVAALQREQRETEADADEGGEESTLPD